MAGQGKKYRLHGAFNKERDAERKAAGRPGSFVLAVRIHGKRRHLVAGPKGTVSLGGLVRV